jgi:hypothetical protein
MKVRAIAANATAAKRTSLLGIQEETRDREAPETQARSR